MKDEDKAILCSLIRDHEDTVGSSRVTMMAIKAFIASIQQVRCSVEAVRELYAELSEAIKNTEPKVIPFPTGRRLSNGSTARWSPRPTGTSPTS